MIGVLPTFFFFFFFFFKAVFVETDQVCHFWCNFLPSYTCWSAVIETLKEESRVKQFIQSQKRLPKWRQHFVKNY